MDQLKGWAERSRSLIDFTRTAPADSAGNPLPPSPVSPKPTNPDAVLTVVSQVGPTVTASSSGTKPAPSSKLKTWEMDWADGTKETGTGAPPTTFNVHAYAQGAQDVTYHALLRVVDRNGRSDTDTKNITVPALAGAPVDCVLGPKVYGAPIIGTCQPSNTQSVTTPWTRTILVQPANGGAACGPTSGLEITSQACVYVPPEPGDHTRLALSDLSVAGVWRGPFLNIGAQAYVPPVAVKLVGSVRHYFTIQGSNGHIVEYIEPALSAPGTAYASVSQATVHQDWGPLPPVYDNGYAPPAGASIYGLTYDDATGHLFIHWTGTYVNIPSGLNGFAEVAFVGSALSLIGVWGINTRGGTSGQPMQAGGMAIIPQWFIDENLPAGQRLGVMGGMYASATSGNSYGPSLEAVTPGAPNSGTSDVQLAAGTLLMRYPANSIGPNCSPDAGESVGCTPAVAPTEPSPATMAWALYSQSLYRTAWDPYAGHGWWGDNNSGPFNWYDDGDKSGVVAAMAALSGWMNTTVNTSPAPTRNTSGFYPSITFAVPSTDSHDGHHVQVGDLIWVQTCAPSDPGYDTANARHLSFVIVTAVNTGTGLITGDVTEPDFGTGDHKPVVGGSVFMGVVYAHGAPGPSRQKYLLQIYDPAHLAEVAQGTRAAHEVNYTEEMDLASFVPQFGSPGGAIPGVHNHPPASVVVDPANKRIILCYSKGGVGGGETLGVVLTVA